MKRILLLILHTQMVYCSLTNLQQHAATVPEVPELSYATFKLHPDYSRWHRQQQPSWAERLLSSLGIYGPVWSPKEFVADLAKVSLHRKNFSTHTLSIQPVPETTFIIIGPLFGSYHSLIRILTELTKQKLLTKELQLTKPDNYLVFTGDTINGSPYNLETLNIILKLMAANPEQVIYLAGTQETNDTWRGFGFKHELTERIDQPDIANKLSTFFATLPRALFITDSSDTIMIGSDSSLTYTPDQLSPGNLTRQPLNSQSTLPATAIITGEKRLMSYAQHGGLAQAPAQHGALTWAVFSAPNRIYQHYYNFTYDAFALLTIGKTLTQSVISLYNQDATKKASFKKAGCFGVLSGKDLQPTCKQPPTTDEKSAPLYIGCTLDLTKGASPLGRRLRDGITLRVNEVNQAGGINGHVVKIVFMDDGYSPAQARENVESFIKNYKSTLFLCNLGSPTLAFYLDLIKDQKIFIFFPSTGAPLFRQPSTKGVVHWRASFKSEGKALTHFVQKEFGVSQFAFLYQNDAFGKGALAGAREIVTKSLAVGYERNTASFKEQTQKIKEAAAGGIGFFSTSIAAIEFIRQTGVEFFIGRKLFGLSDLAEESFKRFANSRGLDMITAQFAPNPETSPLMLAQDFRQALKKQGGAAGDVFMFEGYISASLALNILKKAKSYTPEAINTVLSGIKKESYKGLPLSFNPETRELSQLLWIDTGKPNWIKQEIS